MDEYDIMMYDDYVWGSAGLVWNEAQHKYAYPEEEESKPWVSLRGHTNGTWTPGIT